MNGFAEGPGNRCLPLPPNCVSLDTSTASCNECQEGFLLANGLCRALVVIENCEIVRQEDSRCVLCVDRFYVNPSGRCSPVSSYCGAYNATNGRCLSCSRDGFSLNNQTGICFDPQCLSPPAISSIRCDSCAVNH